MNNNEIITADLCDAIATKLKNGDMFPFPIDMYISSPMFNDARFRIVGLTRVRKYWIFNVFGMNLSIPKPYKVDGYVVQYVCDKYEDDDKKRGKI